MHLTNVFRSARGLVMGAAGLSVMLTGAAEAQQVRTRTVATGLSQPVGVYAPPGDTARLFIVEQNGLIKILDLATGTIAATPLLDLSSTGMNLTAANGERGLLGLAFDPNFASNGRFYVNYTTLGGTFFTRIDRFTVSGPTSGNIVANTASRTTLITFQQDFANHNGGALVFGTDGMLYIGSGDGGSGNDPNNRAVDLGQYLGKILRIDVNDSSTTDGDGLYVPDDNPLRTEAGPRPYIWAYGIRNPWRMSIDRGTGDLYIADVGQDTREEINWQPAYVPGPSGNFDQVALRHYGWDCREGFVNLGGQQGVPGRGCDGALTNVYTDPIKEYTHGAPDNACSITGGHVYRGSAIPELVGLYVVADYCGNFVRAFRNTNGVISNEVNLTSQLGTIVNGLVAVNEDGAGELYLVSINLGRIDKLVPLSTTPCGAGCPTPVNALATIFNDTFETASGWTASLGSGATDGAWQRGVPATGGSYAYNPPFASGGSGNAYVTDNSVPSGTATTSDVDGGEVYLVSPAINGSTGGLTICFDYYLAMTETGGTTPDGLFVEVSTAGTGGPWSRVASFTANPPSECVWTTATITTSQLASAGVTNPSALRIRFVAADYTSPNQSIVEAGIDNVRVQTSNPPPDCNGNGIADSVDIATGTDGDCDSNGIPDSCDISTAYYAAQAAANPALRKDLDGGPVGVKAAGGLQFNNSCVGCHGANGAGGVPGPNIRNKDRFFIRERIVFNRPALHPGGGFTAFTPQQFADLEAFLDDYSSRGRPDGILDSCQQSILVDCDLDGAVDGRELELGTQIDVDYDGIPDNCECRADVNGDGLTIDDIFIFLNRWFNGDPSTDFDGQNGINIDDIFIYLNAWFAGCD